MRDQWPHDYFPRLPEPQKSLCAKIRDRACAQREGWDAFYDLRFTNDAIGTGWRNPEDITGIEGDRQRFNHATDVIRQIVGQRDLDVLLRGLAEDVDNNGDMSVYH